MVSSSKKQITWQTKALPRGTKKAHDYHHILKSLVYFPDAENDPAPKLNFSASWPQVKKFFTSEVPKITKEIINLKDD